MRRTAVAVFVMLSFVSLTLPTWGAERIWTQEEIQSGLPGHCIIRSETEAVFLPIFKRMWAAFEESKGEKIPEAQKEINASLAYTLETISEHYLFVDNKEACPEGWLIHVWEVD